MYPSQLGGRIGMRSKSSSEIRRRAFSHFCYQHQRCRNTNSVGYKNYGGKGIELQYTFEQFLAWFTERWDQYITMHAPQIGRIDHDGHYCLDNIELIERMQNMGERNRRISSKRTDVVCRRTGNVVFSGSSRENAAAFAGVSCRAVLKDLQKISHGEDPTQNPTKHNGYYFKDHEET